MVVHATGKIFVSSCTKDFHIFANQSVQVPDLSRCLPSKVRTERLLYCRDEDKLLLNGWVSNSSEDITLKAVECNEAFADAQREAERKHQIHAAATLVRREA